MSIEYQACLSELTDKTTDLISDILRDREFLRSSQAMQGTESI